MTERPILFSTPMVQAILEGRKTQTRRGVKTKEGGAVSIEMHYQYSHVSDSGEGWPVGVDKAGNKLSFIKCPYGQVGDVLWVRETWRIVGWDFVEPEMKVEFKDGATRLCNYPESGWASEDWMVRQYLQMEKKGIIGPDPEDEGMYKFMKEIPWKPSIFMPKQACRIRLKITDIRVECLQDITAEDAKLEGAEEKTCSMCNNWGHYEAGGNNYECSCGCENWHEAEGYKELWQSINGPESWNLNPWVWVITFEKL